VLVEIEGGIVLIRRGQPPFKGEWALPAGYI
jgi:ADP-ribose pyrophosphatase YjhB (NUDIX family)